MSHHPYHLPQASGEASPLSYQPPTGYAFGGGSTNTPYIDSFSATAGIVPHQWPASYLESAGSNKRRLSAVDENAEDGGGNGQTQVRTKRPRRTLAEPKGESNMAKKRKELEEKHGVGNITKDNKVRGSVVHSGDQGKQYFAPMRIRWKRILTLDLSSTVV